MCFMRLTYLSRRFDKFQHLPNAINPKFWGAYDPGSSLSVPRPPCPLESRLRKLAYLAMEVVLFFLVTRRVVRLHLCPRSTHQLMRLIHQTRDRPSSLLRWWPDQLAIIVPLINSDSDTLVIQQEVHLYLQLLRRRSQAQPEPVRPNRVQRGPLQMTYQPGLRDQRSADSR